jgi:anti-anti-sigma factor
MQMDVTPLGEHLVRIALEGRLDTSGVDRIETRFVASLVPGANNAIVDLSQLDFISSPGIRMFVSVARSLKLRRATLVMYGVQGQVSQAFELVSLQQIIPIRSTEADALTAITSSAG